MDIVYLEPDEEITSVIEKLKRAKASEVRFVVSRGAVLLQSVVNLKLLKKKAEDLKKNVALVTTDKIGRNLASQVGITVYQHADQEPELPVASVESPIKATAEAEAPEEPETEMVGGIRVNRYRMAGADDSEELAESEMVPEDDEIIDEEPEVEEGTVVAPLEAEPDETEEADDDGELIRGAALGNESDDEMSKEKLPARRIRVEAGDRPQIRRSIGGSNRRLVGLALVVLFVCLIGGALLIFLPHATATVYVKGVPYQADLALTVKQDSKTDAAAGVLAGQLLLAEELSSKSDQPTGKKDVGTKAHGTMTISNGWSSDPQPLTQGTRFVADSGQVFRTTTDVTVPGAVLSLSNGQVQTTPGKATVPVEADQPGDSYNIPAGHFTIPGLSADKQAKIYGTTSAAMSGGTSKTITVVTADDLSKLTDAATAAAKAQSLADIHQKAGQATVLDDAIVTTVSKTNPSAKANDEASTVSVTVTIQAKALSYLGTDFRQLMSAAANAKVGQGKTVVLPDDIKPDISVTKTDLDHGEITLAASIAGQSYAVIDTKTIQKALVGKLPAEATHTLAGQPADHIDVSLKPAWVKRLPRRAAQITVRISPLP